MSCILQESVLGMRTAYRVLTYRVFIWDTPLYALCTQCTDWGCKNIYKYMLLLVFKKRNFFSNGANNDGRKYALPVYFTDPIYFGFKSAPRRAPLEYV